MHYRLETTVEMHLRFSFLNRGVQSASSRLCNIEACALGVENTEHAISTQRDKALKNEQHVSHPVPLWPPKMALSQHDVGVVQLC